jgi:3-deoxy-manno-octulosonate cytidylyltransferase (CMP-KDO synthetase)
LSAEVFVNLQGDEPLVEPAHLDYVIELLQRHPDCELATLATPIRSREEYEDPAVVKVVLNEHGQALYFSRSPIPHVRDGQPNWTALPAMFYAMSGYTPTGGTFCFVLPVLHHIPWNSSKKLEQLRALALGARIQVGLVAEAARGVDTWEDYRRFVAQYRQQTNQVRSLAA